MQRVYILYILLLCCSFGSVWAQTDRAVVKGRLIGKESGLACTDCMLVVPGLKYIHSTDDSGRFSISLFPFGETSIVIQYGNEVIDSFRVRITQQETDLGDIWISGVFAPSDRAEQVVLPTMTLEDEPHFGDDEAIADRQNISMLLNSSKDAFLQASAFIFGLYGFRQRIYNRAQQQVYIDGILMNDLVTGNVPWNSWSGLNDVTRKQILTYGTGAHQVAPGGLLGVNAVESSAPEQGALHKFSYAVSNRSYNQRVMYTYSSGQRKRGWSYTFSGSRRWANEAYVPGTAFDALSGFLSVGKELNIRHQLTLSLFGVSTIRARSGAATEEVYQLSGDRYYNANWGWQDGQKRNARLSSLFQPMTFLQHQYTSSENTLWTTTLMIQSGYNRNTALDWYNALDPRPDYYRNLPSYYQVADPATAGTIRSVLSSEPGRLQVDWAGLYAANSNNGEILYHVNGIPGNIQMGRRSLYVLAADVEQVSKQSIGSRVYHKISSSFALSGGLQFQRQRSVFFRQLNDLLGGDYFLNYNQFAAQQYNGNAQLKQNDLEVPDRAVSLGQRYHYHYRYRIDKGWLWGQAEYDLKRISGYLTFQGTYISYSREGFYRNGLFPEQSLGKSKSMSFLCYMTKGGLTYKLNGRQYLFANGWVSAEAPGINDLFIAPRTRNQAVTRPALQQVRSLEAGYALHAPRLSMRLSGYTTEISSITSIRRFYNDEPEYQSFVNFVMTDLGTRYTGIEFGIEYTPHASVVFTGAMALGQGFYTKSPVVQVYGDNDTNLHPGNKEVFIRNYYLGNGPQSAYTAGITYNAAKRWYLKLNGNYLDRNYTAINPVRRSREAAELISQADPLYRKIFSQEKLPGFFTMDVSGGKSFRLRKHQRKNEPSVYCSIGVSNVLNNQNILLAGFEQLRYDFTNNNPDKFPSKYIYGYGRTFFANISMKL